MVSRRGCRLIIGLTALTIALHAQAQAPGQGSPAYVTRQQMEPDKCASIWLIRRHIAPEAPIRLVPADEPLPPGVLFDTPDAPIRRTHAQSTFEVLVDRHGIDDPKVRWLARVLHDIEINTWQRKALARTPQIEAGLWRLIESPSELGMIERCVQWLDALPMPEAASVSWFAANWRWPSDVAMLSAMQKVEVSQRIRAAPTRPGTGISRRWRTGRRRGWRSRPSADSRGRRGGR